MKGYLLSYAPLVLHIGADSQTRAPIVLVLELGFDVIGLLILAEVPLTLEAREQGVLRPFPHHARLRVEPSADRQFLVHRHRWIVVDVVAVEEVIPERAGGGKLGPLPQLALPGNGGLELPVDELASGIAETAPNVGNREVTTAVRVDRA
jgi:hypothetical protein